MFLFAVAAFPQATTQTPTYPGSTSGNDKWGTVPTVNSGKTIGTPGGTFDTGYGFVGGQQFNSKWNMITGNHDLTTYDNGAGKVTSWSSGTVAASRVCSFCHTAHDNEGTDVRTFLWQRDMPASFGESYSSPTLQSSPATTDTSVTAMCLSCHDGTVALSSGNYGTPPVTADFSINAVALTTGGKLSDPALLVPLNRTHPVSFTYDSALAAQHQLRIPVNSKSIDGFGIIPLFGSTGTMECATCHDPHLKTGIMRRQFPTGATQDNNTGSFCLYCHL